MLEGRFRVDLRYVPFICAAFCIGTLAQSAQAQLIFGKSGRLIDIGISGPLAPTSSVECENFRSKVASLLDELDAEHDACIDGRKKDQSLGGEHCDVRACDDLHMARSTVRSKTSPEYAKCMASVSRLGGRSYTVPGYEPAPSTPQSTVARSTLGRLTGKMFDVPAQQAKALARQAWAAAAKGWEETYLSKKWSNSLGRVATGGAIRGTPYFVESVDYLWGRSQDIRSACSASGRSANADACDQELLSQYREFSQLYPTAPGVSEIQDALVGLATDLVGDIRRQGNKVSRDIRDFGAQPKGQGTFVQPPPGTIQSANDMELEAVGEKEDEWSQDWEE